jgi:hypothetical protein
MSSVLEDLLVKMGIANKTLEQAQRLTAERAARRELIKTSDELDRLAAVQLQEALETVIRLTDQYCAELQRQSKK